MPTRPDDSSAEPNHQLMSIGLLLGPLSALGVWWLGPPDGLSAPGWAAVALVVLMVVWWISEAVPIAVTALLPLIVLPIAGVVTLPQAATPYADPIIFLFIGGFMLAMALERWQLHGRLALALIGAVGTRPTSLLLAFGIATTALSMWISNTATALMLMPTAIGVAAAIGEHTDRKTAGQFGFAVVLMVAYAASIGGIGTPIGSPTNLIAMGYLERQGIHLGFTSWMLLAVPIMLLMLAVAWALLAWPIRHARGSSRSDEVINNARRALGPIRPAEIRVMGVFAVVALCWIFRPLLNQLPGLGALSDTAIALIGAITLFVIPSGTAKKGEKLLDWATAERLPWGVALLFGGGLSVAAAMESSGVSTWLGGALASTGALSPWLILLLMVSVTVFVSELASNVATLTAMLPIIAALAKASGDSPLLLAFAACMGASLAFMMPMGTAPNAIAYATGRVDLRAMIKVGLILNLIGIVVMVVMIKLLAPLVLGVK